jgi:hypothetical protein
MGPRHFLKRFAMKQAPQAGELLLKKVNGSAVWIVDFEINRDRPPTLLGGAFRVVGK